MSGHLTLDELEACARGNSTGIAARAIAEHCCACPDCGAELAALVALTAMPDPTRRSARAMSRRLAVVAALVAIPAAAWLIASRGAGDEIPAAAARGPRAADSIPPFARLATTEPPSAGMIWLHFEGVAPVSTSGAQVDLAAAAELVIARDYLGALPIFERAYALDPGSDVVTMYLGLTMYLSGEDSPRVRELLARASQMRDDSFSSHGLWYLANHLLRTGDLAGSRQLLLPLSERPVRLGRLAAELLGKLPPA